MNKTNYRIISAIAVFMLVLGSYSRSSAGAATQPLMGGLLPFGQSGNWNLIFADEFSGGTLDLTKWRPNWLGPSDTSITKPVNSAEVNCYDPQQVTVQNGELN